MNWRWQISAGEFFEWLRPLAFVLAALLSTWVLASARRYRFAPHAVAAWTLGTFLLPLIFFPPYLIAHARAQRQRNRPVNEPEIAGTDNAQNAELSTPELDKPLPWRFRLPLLYAIVVLSLGTLFFYRDYRSVDAHLARANQARIMSQRDRTIRELRAALRLEDNPHTHNLLAVELLAAGQLEEALVELQAAERGGEPDAVLPFRIASTLDALNRPAEALPAYQRFLQSYMCQEPLPDRSCETAQARLKTMESDMAGDRERTR